MFPNHKALAGEIMNRDVPSMTSPVATVAAAYNGVRAAMPLDLLPGRMPTSTGTAADSPLLTHVHSYHCYQQQEAQSWRPCGLTRKTKKPPNLLPPQPAFGRRAGARIICIKNNSA